MEADWWGWKAWGLTGEHGPGGRGGNSCDPKPVVSQASILAFYSQVRPGLWDSEWSLQPALSQASCEDSAVTGQGKTPS